HLFHLLDRDDPEHVFGESEQGAAAHSRAAYMDDLAWCDGNDGGSGSERDDQSLVLAGKRCPADADRGEFIDLQDRPAEQRISERARSRSGGGDPLYLVEPESEIGNQFAQGPRGCRDGVIGLDSYDVDCAVFEDYGVGG